MKASKTGPAIAVAAGLVASVAFGQNFGGDEDQSYAAELWQTMTERDLAGENAVQAFPYPGTDPHGMMRETFYTEATIDGHSGDLVIKRHAQASEWRRNRLAGSCVHEALEEALFVSSLRLPSL
ncbi:hypothetical protein [Roseicyclus sp.]|uniref:hypothetical protein n=1 Tax=Roseicyclus sp. TaxID=1914329 RepID=UPI003F9F350F